MQVYYQFYYSYNKFPCSSSLHRRRQSMVPAEQSAAQPGQSEVLAIGTTQQLHATSSAVSVAGVDLTTADKTKVLGSLGVVFDRRLTFDKTNT